MIHLVCHPPPTRPSESVFPGSSLPLHIPITPRLCIPFEDLLQPHPLTVAALVKAIHQGHKIPEKSFLNSDSLCFSGFETNIVDPNPLVIFQLFVLKSLQIHNKLQRNVEIYTLHSIVPSVHVLHNYSTISKPGT